VKSYSHRHGEVSDKQFLICCFHISARGDTGLGYTWSTVLLVIFHVFSFFFFFFIFFLSVNAVLQLHTDVFTFYSIVAMVLCVVLFAP